MAEYSICVDCIWGLKENVPNFQNLTKNYIKVCCTLCKGEDSELCNNTVYGKT